MREVNDLQVQNEMLLASDQEMTVTEWGAGLYGNFANQSKISLCVILEGINLKDTCFVRITESGTGVVLKDEAPLKPLGKGSGIEGQGKVSQTGLNAMTRLVKPSVGRNLHDLALEFSHRKIYAQYHFGAGFRSLNRIIPELTDLNRTNSCLSHSSSDREKTI